MYCSTSCFTQAVKDQWIRPWTLNHEIPGWNQFVVAVVNCSRAQGKASRRELKNDPFSGCLLSSRCQRSVDKPMDSKTWGPRFKSLFRAVVPLGNTTLPSPSKRTLNHLSDGHCLLELLSAWIRPWTLNYYVPVRSACHGSCALWARH